MIILLFLLLLLQVLQFDPNYLSLYYGRPQFSRGGGVAIINHNSIHHTAISIPSFSSFKCIGSVIVLSNLSFKHLLYIDRLLSLLPTFLLNLNRYLNFKLLLVLIYLFGDFNIHIVDLNNYNVRHFLKLLNKFDLLQHITCPTHYSGHTIDLVITNASSKFIICPFMLDTYISDHKLFDLTLQSQLFPKQRFPVNLRNLIFLNLVKILQLF